MATFAADLKIEDAAGANAGEGNRAWRSALLVLVAAALPYIAALRYGFVYDDGGQILGLVPIRSWSSVPGYFLKPMPGVLVRYYRPAFFFWIRLNYFVWGTHAWGWHLTSIFLHMTATLLVLLLLTKYFNDARWALVGTLIFAVHPTHVESVAWISGCTDELMAVGLLGALLLWIRNCETPSIGFRIASVLCAALALLSKETAVILPILIWLHAFAGIPSPSDATNRRADRLSFAGWQAAPYVALVAAYLAVRHVVLRSVAGAPAEWISPTHAILTMPSLLLFYLRHLIWPGASSLFYDLAPVSRLASASFWVPFVVVTGVAAGIWVWFRRNTDFRVLLGSSFFLLPIIPVLYARVFAYDDFVHDRYLYVPVLGLAIAASLLCELLWRYEQKRVRPWLPMLLGVVAVGSLTLATVVQARPWQSNLSLYSNAVRLAPNNSIAENNLASEYCTENRYQDAAYVLNRLLKTHPEMWLANFNYGYVNYRIGSFPVADDYLHRAIHIDPTDPDQYFYLGTTYFKEGRLQAAADELRRGIARKPDGAGYHFALGLVLMQQANFAAARQEILTEVRYHPENSVAQGVLQQWDKQIGPTTSATH